MSRRCIEIEATIESNDYRNGTRKIIERRAELDSEKLSFNTLGDFMSKFKKLNAALRKATKDDNTVTIVITNYEFEDGSIQNYNRWRYYGNPREDCIDCTNGVEEFTGYYMQPDTKYTPAEHDMVYMLTLESITDN